MEIWFNPSCSKCRTAVSTMETAGEPFTLRSYLETPPTEAELDAVLHKLGMEPWELCRMNEPVAKELDLASLPRDRARWLAVMAKNPILIQRPILVRADGAAMIGRSEEALREALDPAQR